MLFKVLFWLWVVWGVASAITILYDELPNRNVKPWVGLIIVAPWLLITVITGCISMAMVLYGMLFH